MPSTQKVNFLGNTTVTNIIILVNVAIFLVSLFFLSNQAFVDRLAVTPSLFVKGYVWTAVTSMFLHAGFAHLFFNMFSLFFLGHLVEQLIGRKRFFLFYLVAGIVGSLFFVGSAYLGKFLLSNPDLMGDITRSAVGASGALFGLVGILAVLIPKKKVYLIAGPLVAIILQPILSILLPAYSGSINSILTIVVFMMIFAMFSPNPKFRKFSLPVEMPFWVAPIIAIVPLVIVGIFIDLPIANSAHFGGLVIGLIYGAYLRNKYSKKVKMINRMLR